MPSLSQGFDDLGARYPEHSAYSVAPAQRQPEYIMGSNNASPYPDSSTTYTAQPMASNQFEVYPAISSLPSIGEIHGRRDRNGRTLNINGNSITASFSTDPVGNGTSLGSDSDNLSYPSRRHPSYEQNQHHPRHHSAYHGYGSGDIASTGEYPRYGPAAVQHSSQGYPQMYGDMEYPSHTYDGPQPNNFGVLGDSSDARSKRRRGNLPKQVTDILRAWFHEHLDHPYPSEEDKQMFIARTGLSISQVSSTVPKRA